MSKLELLEQCYVLFLNRSNKLLGWTMLSVGTTAGCIIDPKMVYSIAIKANASGVIVAHNHPSGNLKMSEPDITITKKLIEAGKLLEVQLLDHLIITKDSYLAWSERSPF
jgi:DNA repair protein RadC